MKVEFDIKITAADLYDYMLAHTYSGFSGLFGSIVGCGQACGKPSRMVCFPAAADLRRSGFSFWFFFFWR